MQKYATGQMLLGQWKDGHKYVCFIQSQSNTDKGHLCIVFFFGKEPIYSLRFMNIQICSQ